MSRSDVLITTAVAAAGIELIDHEGTVVASGQGQLDVRVEPGLYTAQVSVGNETSREVIAARSGTGTTRHIDVGFETVTPVRSTTNNYESHSLPARAMSLEPQATLGTGSRLVVLARVPSSDPDLAHATIDRPALELLDDALTPLAAPEWVLGDGFSAVSIDVEPGTLVLRARGPGGPVDQSLVTSAGWTTLAFVPVWPEADTPPTAWTASPDAMTVHMVRLDTPFEPFGEGAEAILAAEIALKNLRAGDTGLSRQLLQLLLDEKFSNPMLGIYGAHTLLAARQPRWTLAQIVIRNLRRLVPRHPDVDALHVRFKSARDEESRSRVQPFRMPPMLHASYASVIARDSVEHGLIEEGTIAEAAATELRLDGAWARWDALDTVAARSPATPIDADLADEAAQAITELLPADQLPTSVGTDPVAITDDSRDIARYVTAMAATQRTAEGDPVGLDISQLSRQMKLPVSKVRKELRAIADAAPTKRF